MLIQRGVCLLEDLVCIGVLGKRNSAVLLVEVVEDVFGLVLFGYLAIEAERAMLERLYTREQTCNTRDGKVCC